MRFLRAVLMILGLLMRFISRGVWGVYGGLVGGREDVCGLGRGRGWIGGIICGGGRDEMYECLVIGSHE